MGEEKRIYVSLRMGGRCEDCDLRHALSMEGVPRRHPQYGSSLSAHCDGCHGSGVNSQTLWLNGDAALRRLTLKQRFVVERRLGIGGDRRRYTQRQIAEAMGVSRETVKDIERQAKAKLRAMVELPPKRATIPT